MNVASLATTAWRATAARAASTGLFLDFDGTLAPIQDDPEAVRPAAGVLPALTGLSRAVGHVAIVSARPVAFLADRLGPAADGVDLHGLYGLESRRGGRLHTDPVALSWAPRMAQLSEQARAELPAADIEFKRLSVALHYRTAPELRDVVEGWAQAQARRLGLRLQRGRMVVELKPPGDRDKGTVVRDAITSAVPAAPRGLTDVWYFGDDVSDGRAFAVLRERTAADPGFRAVCVAVRNPETGDALSAEADLTLDSPAAVADFLAAGLAVLHETAAGQVP